MAELWSPEFKQFLKDFLKEAKAFVAMTKPPPEYEAYLRERRKE